MRSRPAFPEGVPRRADLRLSRSLIDDKRIPDDVTIQVCPVASRADRAQLESIAGARRRHNASLQ